MDPTVRTRTAPGPRFSPLLIFGILASSLAMALGLVVAARTWLMPKPRVSEAPALPGAPPFPPPTAAADASVDAAAAMAVADAAPPFDRDTARAAVEAVGKKSADCKLPKKPLRVRVTFGPDGAVTTATVVGAAAARVGACVVPRLKEVSIPAFYGPPVTLVYTLPR